MDQSFFKTADNNLPVTHIWIDAGWYNSGDHPGNWDWPGTWQGVAGKSYAVETCTNLVSGDSWRPVGLDIPATGG